MQIKEIYSVGRILGGTTARRRRIRRRVKRRIRRRAKLRTRRRVQRRTKRRNNPRMPLSPSNSPSDSPSSSQFSSPSNSPFNSPLNSPSAVDVTKKMPGRGRGILPGKIFSRSLLKAGRRSRQRSYYFLAVSAPRANQIVSFRQHIYDC